MANNILRVNNGEPPKSKLSGKEIYSVVDIDSFEAMVWAQEYPELQGKPVVVRNMKGVIIAVSYEAKKFGISRSTKIKIAKEICPSLVDFVIPGKDGKSDQKIPATASFNIQQCVRSLMKTKYPGITVCMKSRDEIYFELSSYVDSDLERNPGRVLDCNPHAKTIWIKDDVEEILPTQRRLVMAAMITEDILQQIKNDTGFVASAGVAYSSIVAKIACGNDKPDALTIVTKAGVDKLYAQTKFKDAPYLKGKNGDSILRMSKCEDALETLLDFKLKADIDDIQTKLHLNDFITKQLKEVATGEDSEPLQDNRKKTLISSWQTTSEDRGSCRQETLEKYVANCCEKLELDIKYENILFKRLPKKFTIQLKRDVSKRNSEGEVKTKTSVLDTRSIGYGSQEMQPGELKHFMWTELCQMWKGTQKPFMNFEQVAQMIITGVY